MRNTVQRPAAGAGRGLHEGHVNLVHVRPFLAIHLDADEMFVEIFCDALALERLAFHHVAPVAGRVADAEEDRLVLRARPGERLLAPREPVHGIVRVLEQIGRLLPREAVGVRVRHSGGFYRHSFRQFNNPTKARIRCQDNWLIGSSLRLDSSRCSVEPLARSHRPRGPTLQLWRRASGSKPIGPEGDTRPDGRHYEIFRREGGVVFNRIVPAKSPAGQRRAPVVRNPTATSARWFPN